VRCAAGRTESFEEEESMTTARHIVTLLKSHIAGDEDRFLSTAMQLAAHEARQGHGKLAQELKELVDAAKTKEPAIGREARPVPLVQPKGELASLLNARYPDLRLGDMILPEKIRLRLERVLREQRCFVPHTSSFERLGSTPRDDVGVGGLCGPQNHVAAYFAFSQTKRRML
jgi:hypothetical protein